MAITCPRCNPGGGGVLIERIFIPTGDVVRVCDECDALWVGTAAEPDPHRFHDFATWAVEHGGTGSLTDLRPPVT